MKIISRSSFWIKSRRVQTPQGFPNPREFSLWFLWLSVGLSFADRNGISTIESSLTNFCFFHLIKYCRAFSLDWCFDGTTSSWDETTHWDRSILWSFYLPLWEEEDTRGRWASWAFNENNRLESEMGPKPILSPSTLGICRIHISTPSAKLLNRYMSPTINVEEKDQHLPSDPSTTIYSDCYQQV